MDPLSYTWTLDGVPVSSSPSWLYTGSLTNHGAIVTLTVSDTNPYSPDAHRVWLLVIEDALSDLKPLPGYMNPPTDPDGDGKYEDLTGNGSATFTDVVLFFDQLDWILANEPVSAFDFSGNGAITFKDIVLLFEKV